MKEFLKLLGWQSLVLVLILSLILRMSITLPFYGQYFSFTVVPSSDYLLFTFALMLMTASLNVICSYYDTKMADILAKTETLDNGKKLRMFWLFAIIGVAALSYLSVKYYVWQIGALALVFELSAYSYALKFKRMAILGNLNIAFLYALLVFMPFLLELFAFTHYQGETLLRMPASAWQIYFWLFSFFAAFVFLLTFIRDLTADLANIEENKRDGFETFAVKYGEKRTDTLLIVLSAAFVLLNAFALFKFRYFLDTIQIGTLVIINILPFVYYVYKLLTAKRSEETVTLYQFLGMIYISLVFTIQFTGNIFTINAN
ncbi:MAG: UbiA family prenyltransferase [Bacteroidales bacterium]|nr:UbiA family prenyltransferase [Bacteroidales bacterium]